MKEINLIWTLFYQLRHEWIWIQGTVYRAIFHNYASETETMLISARRTRVLSSCAHMFQWLQHILLVCIKVHTDDAVLVDVTLAAAGPGSSQGELEALFLTLHLHTWHTVTYLTYNNIHSYNANTFTVNHYVLWTLYARSKKLEMCP